MCDYGILRHASPLSTLCFSMRNVFFTLWLATSAAVPALAQDTIYRCGNEYTNNAAVARQRGCKTLEGGNVTIIQGTRPQSAAPVAPRPLNAPRVDTAEQRARDADSRTILEAELRRAESRQAELVKEYNKGEPEKVGAEHRNHQKYLDRVAELQANIARGENDIASLRRELGRLNPGLGKAN